MGKGRPGAPGKQGKLGESEAALRSTAGDRQSLRFYRCSEQFERRGESLEEVGDMVERKGTPHPLPISFLHENLSHP